MTSTNRLAIAAHEFWIFGLKQAWACLFGGLLLALMVGTHLYYPFEGLHRYDFLFLAAIVIQLLLLALKLESPKEALVIVIFHLVATLMEWFKTSEAIGSWHYPEDFVFGIGNVPLFAGFMYSAVGSYLARVWRLFDFRFSHYPARVWTLWLVALIYINFFSHHYTVDLRWLLLAITALLFWRTRIHFRIVQVHRHMPLLLGWFLVALFIWIAENLATWGHIWIYPSQQQGWTLVSWEKLTAWYLLMLISFVLVTLIHPVRALKD